MQFQTVRTQPFYKGVTRDYRSPVKGSLVYTPGSTVVALFGLDPDAATECAPGIHFSKSVPEALRWGPVVVEIMVPDGSVVVDSGSKLRAESVQVGKVVDLSRADLYGANLYAANLSGADLSGADLYGSDLSRADLSGADLSESDLTGANLYGSDLRHADLSEANLSGANLYEADLSGANLYGATLKYANLHGVSLVEARYDRWTRWPDAFNKVGA